MIILHQFQIDYQTSSPSKVSQKNNWNICLLNENNVKNLVEQKLLIFFLKEFHGNRLDFYSDLNSTAKIRAACVFYSFWAIRRQKMPIYEKP